MTPCLNWRELELLASKIGPEIEGLFVDRIIVPDRERFPEGYLKGEWAFRLTGRKNEGILLLSIRARHPYIAWCPGKGPKASPKATRSPFDLSLSKYLKGAKLLQCQTLPKERVIVFWFSEEGTSKTRLGLVLVLIPAAPEAFLVQVSHSDREDSRWRILTRSRTIRDESKQQNFYQLPNGFQAPPNPVVREDLLNTPSSLYKVIEKELLEEAFTVRCQILEKTLRQLLKQAQERRRQSETSMREAEREENWQRFGDLLKSTLGEPTELQGAARFVADYETDEKVKIPCDPKLSLKEQVEKFYQNSRRKQRRIQEARSRAERFQETSVRLESVLPVKLPPLDWNALEKLERFTGGQTGLPPSTSGEPSKKKGPTHAWLGKSFVSRDGLSIWVGRSKDENLELTFKSARGNDLWMHVRGRPGAHAVIPLQPGKSAPLETLLDAATLTVYYSKGENWGKTEVDYTFKKYVKRIKDSSEASYTHNKTLLITPDPARLKRLLEQNT